MTASWYAGSMSAKRKVTYYVDEEVLRATRVLAAREGIRDSDVVQAALRKYLGFQVVDEMRKRSNLTEDEAMALAIEETHAYRAEKHAAGGH